MIFPFGKLCESEMVKISISFAKVEECIHLHTNTNFVFSVCVANLSLCYINCNVQVQCLRYQLLYFIARFLRVIMPKI